MYNSLQQTILKLNKEFLLEAKNSPQLLADMAAMESYMAESYGERVFIELLQNADDANATSFYVLERNGHVFVANNGKPFDDSDVMSICRSGSSEKKRGETIGYRGVGFKSTTHLSKEILIHSSNNTFTFSKQLAAKQLGGINENKVPTIRIPFTVESVDVEIDGVLDELKEKGYTTVFVFCNANISTLLQEVMSVTSDYFLFLRHLAKVNIQVGENNFSGEIYRHNGSVDIIYNDRKSIWKILGNNKAQIALALNERKEIIPCSKEEAVFHCYLPTYEPCPYLFKINSDFSTDPSRKHITVDKHTESALLESVNLLFEFIEQEFNSEKQRLFEIIPIIMGKNTFSTIAQFFEKEFQELLQSKWIKMQDGQFISPSDYIKKDVFLDDSEWNWIRQHTPLKHSVPIVQGESLSVLDEFLRRFAQETYSINDWVKMLSNKDFVDKLPKVIYVKVYSNLIKQIRNKTIIQHDTYNMDYCYLKVNDILITFSDASKNDVNQLLNELRAQLTTSEAEWFVKQNKLEKLQDENTYVNNDNPLESKKGSKWNSSAQHLDVKSKVKMPITRWRAAEKQCVEFEELQGNIARDVSKQNLGYDVLSVTPTKQERYIEVKSVKRRGDKISMTNNEYTAAHINGDNYFICIIYEEGNDVVFEYIQNPLEKMKLEKVVRQWEWICEDYEGETFKVGG